MINTLIIESKKEYKCFDFIRNLYNTNKNFKEIIDFGIINNKITGFDKELWNKIENLNCRFELGFDQAFQMGLNIGGCSVFSEHLSYTFTNPEICGGKLPILKGTRNCPDADHQWVLNNGLFYDTSLMLIIDEEYSKKLGYIEKIRFNPKRNEKYITAKEFANDTHLKR